MLNLVACPRCAHHLDDPVSMDLACSLCMRERVVPQELAAAYMLRDDTHFPFQLTADIRELRDRLRQSRNLVTDHEIVQVIDRYF